MKIDGLSIICHIQLKKNNVIFVDEMNEQFRKVVEKRIHTHH